MAGGRLLPTKNLPHEAGGGNPPPAKTDTAADHDNGRWNVTTTIEHFLAMTGRPA
jgi:hypothetical protein